MNSKFFWVGAIAVTAVACAALIQRADGLQPQAGAASPFGESYLYVFSSDSGYSTLLKDHRIVVVEGIRWLVGTGVDAWEEHALDWRGGNVVWIAMDKIAQIVAIEDEEGLRRATEQQMHWFDQGHPDF